MGTESAFEFMRVVSTCVAISFTCEIVVMTRYVAPLASLAPPVGLLDTTHYYSPLLKTTHYYSLLLTSTHH